MNDLDDGLLCGLQKLEVFTPLVWKVMAPFVIEDVELIVIVIRGHTALRRTSCL